MNVEVTYFGAFPLEEGEVAVMDGGTHHGPSFGHTLVARRDGSAAWERRTGSLRPQGPVGRGEIALTAEEVRRLAAWADAAWQLAAEKRAPGIPRPPRWVCAVAMRRGGEVRVIDAQDGEPPGLEALYAWMRQRIDQALR